MALIGASSFIPRKTTILPEGGRDFLHRRMMELVGAGVATAGVVLLLALFTFSPGDHDTLTVFAPPGGVGDTLGPLGSFGAADQHEAPGPQASVIWGAEARIENEIELGATGRRLLQEVRGLP